MFARPYYTVAGRLNVQDSQLSAPHLSVIKGQVNVANKVPYRYLGRGNLTLSVWPIPPLAFLESALKTTFVRFSLTTE